MEENEKIGEQLMESEQLSGEENNTNILADDTNLGSLGKFKDADTLLSAYNNLQAEFTRKCQRLSELEKRNQENDVAISQKETNANIPLFEREDWSEKVANFLAGHEDAKQYSKEICNEIMENKENYLDDKSLENAYSKVLNRHLISPEKVANDDEFIDSYILNSDDIKNKVLKIYIDELSKNKAPKVISHETGGVILSSKQPAPQNMEEAKKLAKLLIES